MHKKEKIAIFLRGLIAILPVFWGVVAQPAFSQSPSQSSAYENAIAGILSNPEMAFPIIAKRRDGLGILDQILIRYAIEMVSPERDNLIRDMQAALHAEILEKADPQLIEQIGPLRIYDGTLESLIPSVVMASASGVSVSHPSFYAIPCAVLRLEPGMLNALNPIFGGKQDQTLPRAGCIWGRGAIEDYPLDEVSAFIDASFVVTGDGNASDGAVRILAKTRALQRAMVQPEMLPSVPVADMLPYEGWSVVMPDRRPIFERLDTLGQRAQSELIAYWKKNGADPETARSHAARTLFAITYGADCGGAVPVHAIRVMILAQRPTTAFANLPNGPTTGDGKSTAYCGENEGGGLLHLAVMRPDLLSLLQVRGYFPDIEAPDLQGKTALMVAAEKNSLSAVNWLIEKGADVNARTRKTGPGENPKHGYRTPLHYAAASASLELITRLMAGGADPFNADDEGYRPVDYLTGWVSIGGNRVLSRQDFARAQRLLGG